MKRNGLLLLALFLILFLFFKVYERNAQIEQGLEFIQTTPSLQTSADVHVSIDSEGDLIVDLACVSKVTTDGYLFKCMEGSQPVEPCTSEERELVSLSPTCRIYITAGQNCTVSSICDWDNS